MNLTIQVALLTCRVLIGDEHDEYRVEASITDHLNSDFALDFEKYEVVQTFRA
jgi:hypothetical protein